jgi:hypothetical protein
MVRNVLVGHPDTRSTEAMVTFSIRRIATLLRPSGVLALAACGANVTSSSNADVDAGGVADAGGVEDAAGAEDALGKGGGGGSDQDTGGAFHPGTAAGIDGGGGTVAVPGIEAGTGIDASAGGDAGAQPEAGAATTDKTASGVPIPQGWTLKSWDQFGTSGNVTNFQQLHAKYYEAQYYNRDGNGLVTIPNTVINSEQETYSHFETVIVWASDHLTIQARGQSDGSIDSGELVSRYSARSFCTEAKYRIPSTKGSWPAFWFYGAASGDSSEIDVEQPITSSQGVSQVTMYNHPNQSNIVIADPAFTTQYMTWSKSSFNANTGPHTYTVCYNDSKSSLERYIDGGLIYTATFKWDESLGGTGHGPDAATIVNLAIGGSWPGNVSNPGSYKDDLDLYYLQYFGP